MTGLTALLLFAGWTLVLMTIYVTHRVAMILRGKPADSWTRGRAVESPAFFVRAEHAHANCVENLPVFGAVVLAAYAMGQGAVADGIGVWVLLARLAQSVTHLTGVNPALVQVRAGFFTVQVVLMLYAILALVF